MEYWLEEQEKTERRAVVARDDDGGVEGDGRNEWAMLEHLAEATSEGNQSRYL